MDVLLHVDLTIIFEARLRNDSSLCISADSGLLQLAQPGGGTPLFIRGRAAGQGMVFGPRCPKQGIQFDLPLP